MAVVPTPKPKGLCPSCGRCLDCDSGGTWPYVPPALPNYPTYPTYPPIYYGDPIKPNIVKVPYLINKASTNEN